MAHVYLYLNENKQSNQVKMRVHQIFRLLIKNKKQMPHVPVDLQQHKKMVDDWNTTALGIATKNSRTDVIQLLKDAGAK